MSPGRLLREEKWLQVVLIAALALFIAALGWSFYSSSTRVDRAQTALLALCAQRHDLDLRILQQKSLLRHHRGPRIFGLPRSLIVVGYKRDLTTRHNLSILDCKESP